MSLSNSPLRKSDAPNRFAVDDVEASTERLPTSKLAAVTEAKLSRAVLLSPFDGRAVVNPHGGAGNPLVAAVHAAFSRHLPLTLSPDAIWLTILQGFSHHVNEHAEALRGRLVRHRGKLDLTEQVNELTTEDVRTAVAGFSRQIRDATDPALHDALICDFTTTTSETRTASEIALMDAYSHYFRFSLLYCVCGIPHILLTGCADDWQRMRDRIEVFDTFGLEWWVSRLRPILDEFVNAADGRPNRDFWRTIYKFRPAKSPYDPEKVTGWLVDLFPYLGDGPRRKRSHALEPGGAAEVAANAFPSGLCSVQVRLKIINQTGRLLDTMDLDLVGGLLGVEQASEDNAVSPMISWCLAERVPKDERAPKGEEAPVKEPGGFRKMFAALRKAATS